MKGMALEGRGEGTDGIDDEEGQPAEEEEADDEAERLGALLVVLVHPPLLLQLGLPSRPAASQEKPSPPRTARQEHSFCNRCACGGWARRV